MVNPPLNYSYTGQKNIFQEYSNEDEEDQVIADIKDSVDANGRQIAQQPAYDKIMNTNVSLKLYVNVFAGLVKQQQLGPEGKMVGRYNSNPILNYIIYEVESPDRQVKDYTANVISKNMLSQVDDK